MSKINIRESLRNMDADSCCKYDLLTMYDACPLTDEDKADIAKLLFDNEDPEVIYQKLCTYFCDDDVGELTGLTDVQNVTPFEAIISNVKTGLDQKYDSVFYNDVAGQFEITSKDTTYTFGLSPVEYETDGISLYVDYNYDVPINYTSIKEASEDILNKCIEKVSTASQSNGYVDDDTMEYTVYDVVEDEGRLCAKCMNESTNSFEDIKLGKVNSDAVNKLLNNILNNPNYKLTDDCKRKIANNSAPWGIVMSPSFDITASNALMSTGDFGGSVSFGESEQCTFENGDRVTDGNRKGTVIDCDSIKVLVEWDYSETDDIEWVDKSELSFVECLKESEIPMDTVKKDIQSYLNHNLGSNEDYIEVNDVHNIDKDTVAVEYEVHLSIPIGNGEYERDIEYRALPFRYKYGKWQPVVTESKYDIKTKTTARKLVDKAKADDIEWVMKEDLYFVNALKESENSPEVTYKKDRRLNSTSVIYKGYLIKIDRGGDGYNVYDKYRELEDTGFPSMEAAKKFVDELVTKDKMYESTTNTESYSTEQDLIDAGYKYVASNSPYDLYRKIISGKGDWYAVNYENNTVQHITYAQARGDEPIDDKTGIKKLSMELGKKLLPQNESLGDTDCTESVHLGDVVDWHGTPHVVVNNDEDEDLLTLRPRDKFKDSDFGDDDEGDNSEDVYISPLQLKESVDDGWVKRWSFADKWYKGPFVISKNPEPYKGYHLEKVKPNGATAKHYGNFNSIDDAKAEASRYLKESADDGVDSNRFLPNMEYCPACGGTRFNVKKGVCADCGYDEGDWGYTGTDDLDEESDIVEKDAEGYVNLREAFEDTDELELKQAQQEFSSAATSINSNKLPAIYNMVNFRSGDVVVDFGGGKFDNAVNYLKDKGVTLLVYDPYNRSAEHNKEVLRLLKEHGGADAAVNSNVLNVIKEPEAREAVLKNIKKITKRGAPIYITVYEGRGDGAEGPTKSGYQLNRKTGDYMDEVGKVFSNVKRKGKLITAINESTSMKESIVTDASNIGQGYAAPIMVSLVEKAKELEKLVKEYKNSKDKDSFERFLPGVEDDILDYKSEIEEKIKDFDKYWEVHKKAMLDNISEAVSILKNIGVPSLDSKLSKLNESYSDDEWIDRMWEAFQGISGIKDISEGKKPNTYIVTFDSEGSATARARILLKALIKADLDIELDSSNGSNVFTFITPTNEWEFIKGKMVKDSDGFLTSYDWYRNTDSGLNIFMFGEEEADPDYADWETESDSEAEDWFNSYNGFNDEEELDESVGSSGTTEVISKELKNAAYKLFKTPKWGFESDKEIEDYINPIFAVSEDPKTGDIEVQVRAELGYDNLMDLSEVLDKVISKYDKDAYFEPEQPGILCAFIRY